MNNLFNARLDLLEVSSVSANIYKLSGNVIDNTGNFLATDAKIGDIIYINDSFTNSLLRYSITSIDPSTANTHLIANIQWDVPGQDLAEPVTNGDCIIGRRNLALNTITLTSMSVNSVGEQLETSVKNYEQELVANTISSKENNLSKPTQDGQILSSNTNGVRSWVALPSVNDAINLLMGKPNGLAKLGNDGKLALDEVPSIAITDVFVVNNETEMLALGTTKNAEKGDIASRLDNGYQYVLAGDPSVLSNWHQLSQPVPVQNVNGKTGIVVLTTADVAEGTNLYYTDARVASSPAVTAINNQLTTLGGKVDTINGNLNNYMSISTYDSNKDGKVDKSELADVANNVDWTNVQNKPTLSIVATSGNYNDLINKPDVYTKTQTNTEINKLVNDSSSSATSTYSSNHIDQLLGSSLLRYASNDCIILATGVGVTITKTGNNAVVNCPVGVKIVSLSVHFTVSDLGSNTSCAVDFGTSSDYNTGTGLNSDYSNMLPPTVQVINDVSGSRAYRSAAAFNYNTNSHTLSVTGLLSSTAVWVKLTF